MKFGKGFDNLNVGRGGCGLLPPGELKYPWIKEIQFVQKECVHSKQRGNGSDPLPVYNVYLYYL